MHQLSILEVNLDPEQRNRREAGFFGRSAAFTGWTNHLFCLLRTVYWNHLFPSCQRGDSPCLPQTLHRPSGPIIPIQFPSLHKTLFSRLSSVFAAAVSRATSCGSNLSPQKRHFIASGLISSAQTGHFWVDGVCDGGLASSVLTLWVLATCAGTSPSDLQIGQTLGAPDLRQIEHKIPGMR